eukprot:6636988-Ditylum_brightwellii.AAC.1
MYQAFNHDMEGNKMGVDFDIYSTLEEALREINPWKYCAPYDPLNTRGFPNQCGPDFESTRMDQWIRYDWTGNLKWQNGIKSNAK